MEGTSLRRFVGHADSLNIVRLAYALTLPPRRVRKNKAGDWIGYEGRERVYNFHQDEAWAIKWANRDR